MEENSTSFEDIINQTMAEKSIFSSSLITPNNIDLLLEQSKITTDSGESVSKILVKK